MALSPRPKSTGAGGRGLSLIHIFLVAERSGVLNLGVEGIMLMAAIACYMATVETGSFAVGFIAAVAVGILFALFFAIFAVGLRANQQASGSVSYTHLDVYKRQQ